MSLPKDIIREIFSYLDVKTLLTIIPLISKQWDNETSSLLESRCDEFEWAALTELNFYPRKLRPANALSYVRAIERSLFDHITHVFFYRAYEADPLVVKALLENCPNIIYFEFMAYGSNPFSLLTPWPRFLAPNLGSIKFFRSPMVSTDMIESMTMCLPNLTYVWFYKTYCAWEDIDFLEQYVDNIEYDSTGDDWKHDWHKYKRDEFWKWSQEADDDDDY